MVTITATTGSTQPGSTSSVTANIEIETTTTAPAVTESTARPVPPPSENSYAFSESPELEAVALSEVDLQAAGFGGEWRFLGGEIGDIGTSENPCGWDQIDATKGVHVRRRGDLGTFSQLIVADAGVGADAVVAAMVECEIFTGGFEVEIIPLESIAGSDEFVAWAIEAEGESASFIAAAFQGSIVNLVFSGQGPHRVVEMVPLVELMGSRL